MPAPDGNLIAVGKGEMLGLQTQAGVGIPLVGRSDDRFLYQDGSHVIVAGQGVGREAREGEEQSPCAQCGEKEEDAGETNTGGIAPADPHDDSGQAHKEQGLPRGMDGVPQDDAHNPGDGQINQGHGVQGLEIRG